MSLATLRQLLDHAAEQGLGVPAFNISNMGRGIANMSAARACDAPVSLQVSLNVPRSHADDTLDHGTLDPRQEAVCAGLSS